LLLRCVAFVFSKHDFSLLSLSLFWFRLVTFREISFSVFSVVFIFIIYFNVIINVIKEKSYDDFCCCDATS